MKPISTMAFLTLAVLPCVGCGSAAGDEVEVGTLSVSLSTTSPLNVEYRVRDALFELRGPEDLDIDSEDYLDDPIINELLAAGTYTATLQSGWRIQYSMDGQTYTDIPAELTSANPLVITVTTDQTTPVLFQFEVDERLIDFGP